MSITTWNPSDISASVTLSGSNKIATCTATNQGARSLNGKSAGKWYAEFSNCLFSSVPALSSRGGVGVADSTYSLTTGPQSDNTHSAWVQRDEISVGNGTRSAAAIAFPITTSTVIGVALDQSGALIWFTTDGATWNNGGTANPATGVGGYSLAGAATLGPNAFLAAWLRWNGGPNDAATLNGGDTAFSFSIPSGFLAWNPIVHYPSQVIVLW